MKRMMGLGEVFTSSIKPFSRFSNSPLMPAPACSSARSSVRRVTLRKRRRHVAIGDAHGEALDHGGLSDARLAGEDGVVLAAAREDIDDLPDLEIAAQHGIDLAFLGVLREVDSELIEVGRLAARFGRARRAGRGSGRGGRLKRVLERILHDRGQLLAQGVRLDLLQLFADVADDARKLFVGNQRQRAKAGADLSGAEFERAHGPSLGEHAVQRRAEGRRARVARFQLVEAARELPGEAGFIHAEMFEDTREIGIGGIQQLEEEVLDLDVVMRAREA